MIADVTRCWVYLAYSQSVAKLDTPKSPLECFSWWRLQAAIIKLMRGTTRTSIGNRHYRDYCYYCNYDDLLGVGTRRAGMSMNYAFECVRLAAANVCAAVVWKLIVPHESTRVYRHLHTARTRVKCIIIIRWLDCASVMHIQISFFRAAICYVCSISYRLGSWFSRTVAEYLNYHIQLIVIIYIS